MHLHSDMSAGFSETSFWESFIEQICAAYLLCARNCAYTVEYSRHAPCHATGALYLADGG